MWVFTNHFLPFSVAALAMMIHRYPQSAWTGAWWHNSEVHERGREERVSARTEGLTVHKESHMWRFFSNHTECGSGDLMRSFAWLEVTHRYPRHTLRGAAWWHCAHGTLLNKQNGCRRVRFLTFAFLLVFSAGSDEWGLSKDQTKDKRTVFNSVFDCLERCCQKRSC